MSVSVQAVKSAKAFVAAPAWDDYIIGPYGDLAKTNTDAEIRRYIRRNGGALLHAVGTASMSPKGAAWGVVDPDLRVKDVEGLRIVDGSVLVSMPCILVVELG